MVTSPTLLAAATVLAQEEDHNPLVPEVSELIWGTLAFAVFAFFLAKWVLPRANEALRERTEGIEGKLERAERDRAEAQELLARYRDQLAEARAEAGRIRTEAQSQRQQIIDEARREAQTEATRVLERGESQLAAERQQLVAELRTEIGQLSVTLAGRIVGESLEDEARQRRTIERFLDDLEAQPAVAAEDGR